MKIFQVICINKHSLYERIESIGCIDTTLNTQFYLSEDEAIRQIECRETSFIVFDAKGNQAFVEVEERGGRKFLITMKDGIKTDNLLALPTCTAKMTIVQHPYHPVTPARSHALHGVKRWL